MSIYFSAVGYSSQIKVFASYGSNDYTASMKKLIKKIQAPDWKKPKGMGSVTKNGRIYHYVMEQKYTFLCVTSQQLGRKVPWAFLNDVKSEFEVSYGPLTQPVEDCLEFEGNLEKLLRAYEDHGFEDTISKTEQSLEQVKGVMSQNIETALERGEDLGLLETKAVALNDASMAFNVHSKQLERQMWRQAMMQRAMCVGGVLFVFYIIGAQFCGWKMNDCL